MKIAVEGCCHGELNKIYASLLLAQQKQKIKVDLLICCGDFQAVRNEKDLLCMAVPQKYRQLMDFHEYYSGKRQAPILTLFIGGNHEASNYLWELGYGGWVAPNIYYLGYAGVVRYGGVRIAGLSGIYKYHNYPLNHFERPPYDSSTIRSAYHVRSCDQYRLSQLSGKVDIMLSHDWPAGIEHHGDLQKLLKWKPHFTADVNKGALGSPPAMELLTQLKPTFWFSAHLHVKYAALYLHDKGQSSTGDWQSSTGKVQSSTSEGQSADARDESSDVKSQNTSLHYTKFLSLNKCLPGRSCLQVIDVATETDETPYKLTYDPEWLTILRLTEPFMSYDKSRWTKPSDSDFSGGVSHDLVDITERVLFDSDLVIPDNFEVITAPRCVSNHQTDVLCGKLGIENPFKCEPEYEIVESGKVDNPEEISLDDDDVAMDTNDVPPDGDGFVIDTVGKKRPSLSLPPPENTPPQSHDQSPQSHDQPPQSHDVVTESHDTATPTQSQDTQSHDKPKIKRRNVLLYATPTDEQSHDSD